MSEHTVEGGDEPAEIELPRHPDQAFSDLMDILVPDAESPEAGSEAGAAAGDAGAGDPPAAGAPDAAAGAAAADGAGAGGDAGAGAAAADGAAGDPPGDPQQSPAAGDSGDRPESWTASAADLSPQLGELKVKLEETTAQAYQNQALEAVREEYSDYFNALDQHPRLLVGQTVPAIGREGSETLRDTNDAREWQEAVKSILVSEVRDRAGREMESSRDFLDTVHASIDLFQNNPDLMPGTKDFDLELAERFTTLAEPYELRVDGKLNGYSVPVQPLVNQIRAQLGKERAAAPTPAAPADPPAGGAAADPLAADPPQAGIASKAGAGTESEDFSVLFGTLGMPNIRI